jgi:FkbM family methyltransferase
MVTKMLEALYVIASRKDIPAGGRVRLLFAFFWLSVRRKFIRNTESVPFLGYRIFFRTYENLLTILKEVFLFGEYRPLTVGQNPFIIDCGGNIGITTLFFKQRFPGSNILVFEPLNGNCQIIRKNIEGNRLQGVRVVEAAVGSSEGTITFWEDAKKPGSSTAVEEVVGTKGEHRFQKVNVSSVQLSTYIDKNVDLLKMDIEGGEGIVFEELDRSGAMRRIREIVFEYHVNPKNSSNNLSKIVAILERNGFKLIPGGSDLVLKGDSMLLKASFHYLIHAVNTTN